VLLLVAACAALGWVDDAPLVPRNGGHPGGNPDWGRLFLWLLVGAFVLYLAALRLLRHGLGLREAVALACAIQLVPLAGPLLLSTDAWTYWDQGRIAVVHGGNPYRDEPREFPADPALPYVGTAWRDETSVYGPAFVLASEPLARAAGSSADATAWIYKAIAGLGIVAAAILAARLSERPAAAAVFVGWNPVLAVHLAGGGHNDAWMAGLVVGALALGATGRRQLAGVSWVAAIFIKWIPLIFLPLRALEARRNRRAVGHLGFALAAVVLVAVATWRYGWHWLGALGPLARNANQETSFAIPHRLEQIGFPDWLAFALVAAAFAAAYLWLLREAWRGRARLALAAGFLLLATPYLVPWYAIWVVPLAAVEEDRVAQGLALVLCAYMLRQTIPL
jgi:hypothetical protein